MVCFAMPAVQKVIILSYKTPENDTSRKKMPFPGCLNVGSIAITRRWTLEKVTTFAILGVINIESPYI